VLLWNISLLIILFAVVGCENDPKKIEQIFNPDHLAMDRVENVLITYSDSARKKVTIEAPLLEYYVMKDRSEENHFPEGVLVKFFDDEGVLSSRLYADRAIQYPKRHLIIARDNVKLVSMKKDTFRTEELFWDESSAMVYTNAAFKYSNPDEVVYGYKFKSDQNFNNWEYEKMSGQIMVDNRESKNDENE
jgi:LPS export ABC transporter protein LptC